MLEGVDAGTVAHIYRQGAGTRSTSSSSRGRATRAAARRLDGGGDGNGATGVPAAVSALLAGEIESLPEVTARC